MRGLHDVIALEAPNVTVSRSLPVASRCRCRPLSTSLPAGDAHRRSRGERGAFGIGGRNHGDELRVGSGHGGGDVRGRDVVVAADGAAWQKAVFSRAAGQALLLPLLALALAALLAEAYVSSR